MSNALWITLTQTMSCNYNIHIDASLQKRGDNYLVTDRPPDKSEWLKIIFLFLNQTYVVGTQKNRLNLTVLLSTQNTFSN